MSDPAERTATPVALWLAAALVLAEALAIVGYGVLELREVLAGDATVALTTGVFFLAYGVASALAARGLVRGAGWARGWVLATQLIQLGVAWSLRGEPTTAVAAVLGMVAVVVVVATLSVAGDDA